MGTKTFSYANLMNGEFIYDDEEENDKEEQKRRQPRKKPNLGYNVVRVVPGPGGTTAVTIQARPTRVREPVQEQEEEEIELVDLTEDGDEYVPPPPRPQQPITRAGFNVPRVPPSGLNGRLVVFLRTENQLGGIKTLNAQTVTNLANRSLQLKSNNAAIGTQKPNDIVLQKFEENGVITNGDHLTEGLTGSAPTTNYTREQKQSSPDQKCPEPVIKQEEWMPKEIDSSEHQKKHHSEFDSGIGMQTATSPDSSIVNQLLTNSKTCHLQIPGSHNATINSCEIDPTDYGEEHKIALSPEIVKDAIEEVLNNSGGSENDIDKMKSLKRIIEKQGMVAKRDNDKCEEHGSVTNYLCANEKSAEIDTEKCQKDSSDKHGSECLTVPSDCTSRKIEEEQGKDGGDFEFFGTSECVGTSEYLCATLEVHEPEEGADKYFSSNDDISTATDLDSNSDSDADSDLGCDDDDTNDTQGTPKASNTKAPRSSGIQPVRRCEKAKIAVNGCHNARTTDETKTAGLKLLSTSEARSFADFVAAGPSTMTFDRGNRRWISWRENSVQEEKVKVRSLDEMVESMQFPHTEVVIDSESEEPPMVSLSQPIHKPKRRRIKKRKIALRKQRNRTSFEDGFESSDASEQESGSSGKIALRPAKKRRRKEQALHLSLQIPSSGTDVIPQAMKQKSFEPIIRVRRIDEILEHGGTVNLPTGKIQPSPVNGTVKSLNATEIKPIPKTPMKNGMKIDHPDDKLYVKTKPKPLGASRYGRLIKPTEFHPGYVHNNFGSDISN